MGTSPEPKHYQKIIKATENEIDIYQKLFPDVSVIRDVKIKCTICLKDVKHVFLLKKKCYKHVFLRVAVCKSCLKFYGDGDFSPDEEGDDKYCRWCGQGGSLFMCSKCPAAFCKKCIKQNLDRNALIAVDKDDWKCYFCDPSPLHNLRALTWAVDSYLEGEKAKEDARKNEPKQSSRLAKVAQKIELPSIDCTNEEFLKNFEQSKGCLDDLCDDIVNACSIGATQAKQFQGQIQFAVAAEVNGLVTSIAALIDSSIAKLNQSKNRIIERLVKLTDKPDNQTKNGDILGINPKFKKKTLPVCPVSKNEDVTTTPNNINDNSFIDMFDAPMEIGDDDDVTVLNDDDQIAEDTQKPTIRLRNMSDLLENGNSKKSTTSATRFPKSRKAAKAEPEYFNFDEPPSPELICLMSDDEEDTVLKPKSIKSTNEKDNINAKLNKGRKSNRSINNRSSSIPNKCEITEKCQLSKFPNEDEIIELNDDDGDATIEPDQLLDTTVEPVCLPSESDSGTVDNCTERQINSDKQKVIKERTGVIKSTVSSSSSDPLSSISSSGEDEDKISDVSILEKAKQKKRKMINRANSSLSDPDSVDADDLCRRRSVKKLSLSRSKRKSKEEKSKEVKTPSDYDSSDCDISKLCDLSTLNPKRKSIFDSTGNFSESEKSELKKSNNKAKKAEDHLSDFYDGRDNEEPDDDPEHKKIMEDFHTTLRTSLAHVFDDKVSENDMKKRILQMSSSSEKEPSRSDSEESKKKKSRKGKQQSIKTKSGREKRKKKYEDKLMKVKIDSDDDMEKGEAKFQRYKEKMEQAALESDDDVLEIKKKAVTAKKKGRGRPRKKMFSDSDESPVEAGPQPSGSESDKEKGSEESCEENDKNQSKRTKGSDTDTSSSEEKKPKKRRRIKTGSDSSGSDDEKGKKNDSPNKSGRKSIRKILKEDDLKQTTQAALKAEQERKQRIAEKQKLYNKMWDNKTEEEVGPKELTELVLDFDPKTKEKIVEVNSDLVKKLKPHQAEGIKFMWDCCFESVEMTKKKNGSGCILAHCMGLGKSLQVVTLVHTLMTNPDIGVRTVMVVAPLSTVLNWVNEFDKWLSNIGSGHDVNVFHINKAQANYRAFVLKDWERCGGVLIMGYNLLRTMTNPKARIKPAFKKIFQEKLVDPGPDVVICDEGHILKNEKTAINVCMSKLKTRRRIVLTGTPLQNNLIEYHCMVQFVKPNLLGTKKEYTNQFVNPIQNGQFEDSTFHDVRVMKRRAHVLHTMLDGLVQRKDYRVLTPYLPPKYEYVIHLKLSDVQVKLYRFYLLNMVNNGNNDAENPVPKGKRLFIDFQNLMWICLHPRTLLMKREKDEKKMVRYMEFEESDEEGSLKDFIDDGNDSSSSSDFKESSSDSENGSGVDKLQPSRRKTRGQGSVSDIEEEPPAPVKQWWSELVEDSDLDDIQKSSKLFIFFNILKYCEEIGDKLLVFSQSLYTLDLIEYFLDKADTEAQKPEEERTEGIKGFEGSWAKGLDYFRLDGSSACENRESWCKSFNREDNHRARLFLISTRAGGLGINLTGANRVIIFDASWNPSFDVQSLFRVYRFGQTKPCYIYRLLSKGTMEEKIYERQVAKLSTSLRVIDEHQIDRHFSHSALAELYMFDPDGSELQGTPVLPKDRLMAELLQTHKDIILSHHQHDSLLENKEDQELTEEERKAAWAEFENEKNQQPTFMTSALNFPANMMMEIRKKLHLQNPSWTDEQLRLGTFQVLQRYPEMNSFMNIIQQQNQLQPFHQSNSQMRPTGSLPRYPLTFPSYQYPIYTSNTSLASRGNALDGNTNYSSYILKEMLNQANANSMLTNPKFNPMNNLQQQFLQRQVNLSSSASQSPSSSAKSTTEPIVLNDD